MKIFSVSDKTIGIIFASLAAITFGMNPFFGIPLYQEGLEPLSVLFYRFSFATVLIAGVMLLRKESFKLPLRYLPHTIIAGILLALTCLFWFLTFKIMDSGIAATILFIYPVMVAAIMLIFYKERIGLLTAAGMAAAIGGVILLCQPGAGGNVNIRGIIYILLSALTYSIYIVGIQKSRIRELADSTLTFYALLFSIPVFLIPLRMGLDLQMLPSWKAWGNAIGLGVFPSLCSFLFTALAVRRIGPTTVAVLGALEPVTAVLIGAFFFHEVMNGKIILGIIVILAAVSIVICGQSAPVPEKKHD
jgi:drug/metabolite transporter (DMT)-like permease